MRQQRSVSVGMHWYTSRSARDGVSAEQNGITHAGSQGRFSSPSRKLLTPLFLLSRPPHGDCGVLQIWKPLQLPADQTRRIQSLQGAWPVLPCRVLADLSPWLGKEEACRWLGASLGLTVRCNEASRLGMCQFHVMVLPDG